MAFRVFHMSLQLETTNDMRVFWERFCRALAFAKFGWDNIDFDSHALYGLMEFKLKRIQRALNKGYSILPAEATLALQEAIDICKRLYEENHDEALIQKHYEKWGRPELSDKEIGPLIIHQNVRTEEDEKQEREEFLLIHSQKLNLRLQDLARLYEILKVHQPYWWD